jgi:uroporphyrinogen-III synthase
MKIYSLSPKIVENAIPLPTIEIEQLPKKVSFSGIDTLIFTSKVGVQSLNRVNRNWKRIPAIVVGKKSADEVRKFGGTILKEASGDSKSVLELILNEFHDRRFLYIRPKRVALDLSRELKTRGIFVVNKILYETRCKISREIISEDSIVIATSPSTLKCFFQNYTVPKSTKFVSIGETTAKTVPAEFITVVPPEPSLEACYKLAKKISKN